jgi:hypothetical protein
MYYHFLVTALLFKINHPSLFAVSQICGVAARIEIIRLQKSIRIVRHAEQLLDPYRVLFQEMKEKQKQLTSQRFCKEKINNKHY